MEIVKLYSSGMSATAIAKKYGISRTRVYQIIASPEVKRICYRPRMCKDGITLLKKVRLMRGLTREKLTMLSGVSSGTLQRIEKGNPVKKATAEKIATALGCKLDAIFEEVTAVDSPGNRYRRAGKKHSTSISARTG